MGLRCTLASALASALAFALACEQPREKPLDLILISLDSVRGDAISFRDPEATPHLTELAKRGTVFTQAISGTSWTLPAHVEMMTGTPPVLHGVEDHDVRIDPRTPLLAERLRDAGYFTAGFFSVGYLWGDYGFARGFDLYESAIERHHLELEDAAHAPRGVSNPAAAEEVAAGQRSTSLLVRERVDRMLVNLESDQPLFLFLHFFDPHYDYLPPPPYDTRFDPDYSGTIDGRNFLWNPRIWDEDADPPRRISDRDLEHVIALYRGEIAWTDHVIGEIFERLAAAGRLDRAVVVVTADHGEEFFDHQRRGHRQTLYDEVLRVPLLVRPPVGTGRAAVPEVGAQVSLSDLMPTLLDYAGAEVPNSVHGRSLRPAVEGEPFQSRPAISSLYIPSAGRKGRHHHLLQTIRTPEEKLLRHVLVSPTGRVRVPEVLYYDLRSDSKEQRPITDLTDPRVQASWDLMERELDAVRERWSRLPHSPAAERATDMDRYLLKELKALGYIEESPEGSVLELPWGLAPPPPMSLGDPS